MSNYYDKLKKKIHEISKKNDNMTLEEIKAKYGELLKGLEIDFDRTSYTDEEKQKIVKEIIVHQYEETKENNITIGAVTEKRKNKFISYLIIFDDDVTLSKILVKFFDLTTEYQNAENYFNFLKDLIINNDLQNISKYILENITTN